MNRFLRAPRTVYLKWKYRNSGWERPDIPIQDIVGGAGEWDLVSTLALSFLKQAGLQPHHTFLDAGCGPFRLGRLLIRYLDPGHYTGFDGSRHLLEQGRAEVLERECDLAAKRPRIEYLVIDERGASLHQRLQGRFDFILFHMVFEALPPSSIEAALRSVASVMHADSRVFATFFLNPFGDAWKEPILRRAQARRESVVVTYPDREYWHHTPDFFERICQRVGTLQCVACHDYHYPVEGVRMAEFRSCQRA